MLDKRLIKHCAPTLAMLKTANLFTCPFSSGEALDLILFGWNRALNPKGVSLHILCKRKGRALIYVCRDAKLAEDFRKPGVQKFLTGLGYHGFSPECCIEKLKMRFSGTNGFPHEIGLFLGYPVEDVKAYIKHGGRNYVLSGDWKVYHNECEAIKLFRRYKKCRDVYAKLFENRTKSVYQLTVPVN